QFLHTVASEAPVYKVGDRVQAINITPERRILGDSRIASVAQKGRETTVTISPALPLMPHATSCKVNEVLCGSRVVNLDAANEGSRIRNCTIHGSMVLRSKVTVEGLTLNGFLQIGSDPTLVGPLPDGIVIQNSNLNGNIYIGPSSARGLVTNY